MSARNIRSASAPKRTPGPWVHRPAGPSVPADAAVFPVHGAVPVAEVISSRDAPLIAAAPDLLDALTKLLERSSGEYWPIEQEMARAAIAKAEGRS